MSELFNFPSSFVYTEKIANHAQIKSMILKDIISLAENNTNKESDYFKRTGKYSNSPGSGTYNESMLSILLKYKVENSIIWEPLDRMLKHEKLNISKYPKQSVIHSAWYNMYKENSHHRIHSHLGASTFSGIYILDIEGENSTTFVQDGIDIKAKSYCPKVDEGTVIIFPSDLLHEVPPVKGSKISIAFNIQSSF